MNVRSLPAALLLGALPLLAAPPAPLAAQAPTKPTPSPAAPAPAKPAPAASPAPAVVLSRETVPAAGRQEALLRVARFGRYALTVTSAAGSTLQLVDRMAGPGETAGAVGQRDGRLDVFLEQGEYKLVTVGDERAKGTARLAARPFVEAGPARPPRLVELKPVAGELRDLQQVSWWIEVEATRHVVLEAAGRSLGDLRLWREGTWLVAAGPQTEVVQPVVGRPLRVCRLSTPLEPGLYLLTAYGAAAQPWSEEGEIHPFHLRFGIPRLAEAGRQRRTVSAFGVDRFLVPGKVTYARLELPEARPASLRVGSFDADEPFAAGGALGAVTKKTVPPVAELGFGPVNGDHVLSVSGEAGQPYVLQQFEARDEYPFHVAGEHWVSTVHSGHAADAFDATALLVPRVEPKHLEPLAADVIALGPDTGWSRRANLLDTMTEFVKVAAAGSYEVLCEGTEAQGRFEPFLVTRPPRYEPPPLRGCPFTADLDAGYHVLTVSPVRKGIATLTVRPKGILATVLHMVGLGSPEPTPPRAAVRFPSVQLDTRLSYTLYLNRRPEVRSGVVVRALPVDLVQPLPLAQRPGEEVTVPFRASEPGTVLAEAEDGKRLELSVDGGAWQTAAAVDEGQHRVAVRVPGPETVLYSLGFHPRRLQADAPLPELPDTTLAALPQFPVLEPGQPRAFDLDREGTATFRVVAGKPGLYRLESTGLLATSGSVRSRTVTSLAQAAQNGVGRNFLVQSYLREGEYQVTVRAEGLSRGHLGLGLARSEPRQGGFLTSRIPARASLPAGDAVAYRFHITRPGEFRLRALGLGRTFRCRLEDAGGWPLLPPGGAADVTRDFHPGRYRLVILPEATDARVVTVIEPIGRPRPREGHGPHDLRLDRAVDHVWLEPEEGAPRRPDVWRLTLPADAEVSVELTGEMEGRLLAEADAAAAPVVVPPGRGWRGPLAKGAYRLETVCSRRNNRAQYRLAVRPTELLPGLDREVSAPAQVPLSIGQAGLVEVSSFGTRDVKATLLDEAGRILFRSDDRPDDWNFHLAASLEPGRYQLLVDGVGGRSGSTTVSVRVPKVVERPALAVPAALDVTLGKDAAVHPLTLPAAGLGGGDRLLVVRARSAESLGLAVEAGTGGSWRVAATASGRTALVAVPLRRDAAGAEAWRLRLWSLDRRDSPVRLAAALVAAAPVAEGRLRGGVPLLAVAGLSGVTATAVDLDAPGLLQLDGAEGLLWCAEPGRGCRPAGPVVAARERRAWLVAEGTRQAKASRVRLRAGEAVTVPVEPGSPVVADLLGSGEGPVLVVASSQTSQPGVALDAPGLDPAGAAPPRTMAVGPRSAAAVALGGGGRTALFWIAAGVGTDLRLERWSFRRPVTEKAEEGAWEGALEGVSARAFSLPAGPKLLRLALGPAVVGVLSRGDEVLGVHWAGGGAFAEAVESEADRLTLLHAGAEAGRFAVERLPLLAASPALAPGRPLERSPRSAGTLRLAVAPSPGATLHVRGGRGEATLVRADGSVRRGLDLPAGEGGTLLVPQAPGLVLAWLDRPGSEAADLWAGVAAPPAQRVEAPASVPLAGAVQSLRLDLAAPAVLHLRTGCGALTRLSRGAAPPAVEVHPVAVSLDAPLGKGPAELTLRAVAGQTLSGVAELLLTPIVPVGEGLGPEVLLSPGATRFFSFAVEREGAVGVGVQASAEVVEATLLDAGGRVLGTGTAQMPKLSPGTYLLALRAPADAAPVTARTALAGLRPPDTGPPEDVVRAYLQPGETPSFAARRAERVAEEGEMTEGCPDEEEGCGVGPEDGTEGDEAGGEMSGDEEATGGDQ